MANTNPTVRTCWGESVPDDTPCFIETTKPQQNVTQWRVTKGMMDSSNRNSLRVGEPVNIGQRTASRARRCRRTSRSPPATGSGS